MSERRPIRRISGRVLPPTLVVRSLHKVSDQLGLAGELRARFSAAGDRILRYYMDFRHLALDLHKDLSAPELSILQNKVDTLMAQWDKKYEAHLKKEDTAW